ncbi:cytidylate kinase [Halanaerobium saccharolyticum]|jgi:cytidylate kinase|uniref:Cytidylate kinase n=1 Tax=Halanaerobium saccharolyticum TaxID=43595 RepID=A0A2T5RK86_9FIRM|nr:(d)CMP kinase [Halanaerobium saccharolyticum]PTV99317.1 cytidylate kinase [Halanaerobium saccharolyticum]PUU95208.1 MAG: cytidylate kinase [Halanaerobium sp.]TDP90675.1 cytidylate kinase [Halanaerobium saccharolyticum]
MENVVAIDGPGGAGKSTIARLLAQKLNYLHLDTGAMYRAVTLAALRENIDFNQQEKLIELARKIDISFDQKGEIFLDGENVSEEIRKAEVNKHVSQTAAVKGVRDVLVKKQQQLARNNKVVMDGRDITTVVLPEADHKFFLTASLEERARRRYQEVRSKNKDADFEKIKESIARRDKMDSEREHSPLKKAEDAVLVDTTNLSIDEVLAKMIEIIEGEVQ